MEQIAVPNVLVERKREANDFGFFEAESETRATGARKQIESEAFALAQRLRRLKMEADKKVKVALHTHQRRQQNLAIRQDCMIWKTMKEQKQQQTKEQLKGRQQKNSIRRKVNQTRRQASEKGMHDYRARNAERCRSEIQNQLQRRSQAQEQQDEQRKLLARQLRDQKNEAKRQRLEAQKKFRQRISSQKRAQIEVQNEYCTDASVRLEKMRLEEQMLLERLQRLQGEQDAAQAELNKTYAKRSAPKTLDDVRRQQDEARRITGNLGHQSASYLINKPDGALINSMGSSSAYQFSHYRDETAYQHQYDPERNLTPLDTPGQALPHENRSSHSGQSPTHFSHGSRDAGFSVLASMDPVPKEHQIHVALPRINTPDVTRAAEQDRERVSAGPSGSSHERITMPGLLST